MARMIGPTFADELIAAGLGGLPFTWSEEGLHILPGRLSAKQEADVRAVLAAHDPTAVKTPIDDKRDAYIDTALTIAQLKAVLKDVLKGNIP